MKINVFDIKFKTNPNQPINMTNDPFVLEVPDSADINSYIAAWFDDNYNAIPTFDWEFIDEDDESESGKLDEIRAVLRRYFEADDNGNLNPEFDEDFEPQAAIDAIHEIVGNI